VACFALILSDKHQLVDVCLRWHTAPGCTTVPQR